MNVVIVRVSRLLTHGYITIVHGYFNTFEIFYDKSSTPVRNVEIVAAASSCQLVLHALQMLTIYRLHIRAFRIEL